MLNGIISLCQREIDTNYNDGCHSNKRCVYETMSYLYICNKHIVFMMMY